jgi:hypothetical protein
VLYEKNWTHLVHEQLRKFETNVVAATKVEGYDGKELLDADLQWSFSGALLYSVTVITTIGMASYQISASCRGEATRYFPWICCGGEELWNSEYFLSLRGIKTPILHPVV